MHLFLEGRFAAALAVFGATPPNEPLFRLAYAEALCETGQVEDAASLAKDCAKRFSSSTQAICAARRVLAVVCIENGDRQAAFDELGAVVQLADASGEWDEGARAALRLFTLHHNATGRADSAQFLEKAKRFVLKANRPILLADLHSRVGQAEAQEGNLVAARTHLRRGLELLEENFHAGLLARTRLALSSTLALLCENGSAAAEAQRALSAAEEAGSIALARLCRANVAQLLFRTGALDKAADIAAKLLSTEKLPAPVRLAVIETFVASRLESGIDPKDIQEAQDFLRLMNVLHDPNWIRIEAVPTQARLLLRLATSSEARRALQAGRANAEARHNAESVCRLALIEAEIAFKSGDARGGERLLGLASVAAGARPSAEIVALLERSRGLAAACVGLRAVARRHFKRSERVLVGCGLRTEARRTQRLRTGELPYPEGRPAADVKRSFALMGSIADSRYLASLAPYPQLLARELIEVLRSLELVSSAALVPAGREDRSAHSVYCGDSPDGPVTIVYEPSDDYVSRERLLALCHTVSSAVSSAARENEREVYAGFFGIDHAPEGKYGLYISPPMRALLSKIRQIARTDITVLVTGETGTGKEIVAEELHAASPRAQKPFIPINVTAVPRDMLEGLLFGYRRGAFTGAVSDHKGLIREAEGGTLFIDEIGELSPELQPKLLRFLESGEIQPLGERPQRVDVRVVAATNASLEHLVREGRFREDLFYRLNVIQLAIPPLRDRREEIPTLVHHFLTRHAQDAGKPIPQLSPRALECLSGYHWPGNVRQLTNEIKRLVALADEDETVDVHHLAHEIRLAPPPPIGPAGDHVACIRLDQPLQQMYEDVDRAAIPWALRVSRNNQRIAAARLGLTRKGLYVKRARVGLLAESARTDTSRAG